MNEPSVSKYIVACSRKERFCRSLKSLSVDRYMEIWIGVFDNHSLSIRYVSIGSGMARIAGSAGSSNILERVSQYHCLVVVFSRVYKRV